MRKLYFSFLKICSCLLILSLTSCANTRSTNVAYNQSKPHPVVDDSLFPSNYREVYTARMPEYIDTAGKKTVVVDPNVHAWGAYDQQGRLVRAGIATAGAPICPPDATDESDCRTGRGTYHITAMGDDRCASKKYPRPTGGGLMPFCMYFNNGEALHGSPDDIVVEDNISHGCVRMRIPDAEWMRYNFASVGTKVVVLPYN
jgi:lipoprotein-anchoring transpeptidase ErfK/SrfK